MDPAAEDPDLTSQQRAAIETRDVSVALSAGAGCGKTFVLTERFLSHLEPDGQRPVIVGAGGARLADLVAITFTDRAAREMRDRIRGGCQRRLAKAATPEEARYWQEVVRDLQAARVSTIHAFCNSLLRSHAAEAGLDPRFRTLDRTESSTLLAEAIDDLLRRQLAERSPAAMDLSVTFGIGQLKEMSRRLLGRAAEIDFAAWRSRTPDKVLDIWADRHQREIVPRVLEQLAAGPEATALLELLRAHQPSHAAMAERRAILLERLPKLPGHASADAELALLREAAKVQGGGGKGAWESETVYEAVRDGASRLRSKIDSARRALLFERDAARPAAEAGLQLLELVEPMVQNFRDRKAELAGLDFDDLLQLTARLLEEPRYAALQRRVSSQIDALLVDEFQDTDPLQVRLVEALCGGEVARGKLFFVGDHKQSIYRFRGADPHVFRRLREAIPERGRLPLTLNFRSQPQILAFVNALFADEFGPDYEPLRAHRPQVGPTPAIEFLWAPAGEEQQTVEALRKLEADWIARRLKQLLDSGAEIVWDEQAARDGEPGVRAVRPGDIALLFRALTSVAHYEDALRRHGIDYYLVGGHAFYAQQEILDLLNLLRALANPGDHVSLAGVLRSPFFSLADETLLWLSSHREGLSGGLFDVEPHPLVEKQQQQRVEFAAATLRELRSRKDRLPVAQLIQQALQLTGYDAVLLGEFLGERKLANLRKLVDQARQLDASGAFTLADFITQLSEFVAQQPDEPLAATHPESTDVVRLMTVHQSKGLEFPVVVVPDLGRRTHGSPTTATFDSELGPLVNIADIDTTTGLDLWKRQQADEADAETTRLFYVATTRAADYLLLSAGVSQVGAADGPWMRLLGERFDLETGGLQVELPPACDLPLVRVTTTEPPLPAPPESQPRRSLGRAIAETEKLAAGGRPRRPKTIDPVPPDAAARREFSFSRLSGTLHALQPPEQEAYDGEGEVPAATTGAVDPLGLGTLVHAVLEEARPGTGFDAQRDVEPLVRRHAELHVAPDGPEVDEAVAMLRRFLVSPRSRELAAARAVHREIEFLLAWPPGAARCERYLRGYIDCLYQDPRGAWHLLDYKTNRALPATVPSVAARYEMQMLVYALAAERALGERPETLALCFLRPGVEYHFQLDEAARHRVLEQVNLAMDQFVQQDTLVGAF